MTASLDNVFSALSDETRRAILDRLARGPARISDVAAPFAMSLNAVSKHVKVLERAGLVRRTQQGREHTLAHEAGPLRAVARYGSGFARFWNDRLDRLEAFIANHPEESS